MDKRLKWALIITGISVLLYFGGLNIYHLAYSSGELAGHDNGYSTGQEEGYNSGKTDGYNSGRIDGYILGKQEGYEEGYNQGKPEGYEDGVQAGLGHGHTLRDPTYEEAITFLEQDNTDSHQYIENTYICSHFAKDVCNNAEATGLRCALVDIRYADGGHSIIAFNTIDKGLIYFEPQFDLQVEPKIGECYHLSGDFAPPPFNDTIKDILVIW